MLVGFHILQNEKFVKVFSDKMEIIDKDSCASLELNTDFFDKDYQLRSYLAEINPHCFALMYTKLEELCSFLCIVDLKQSRITVSQKYDEHCYGVSRIKENEILIHDNSGAITFEYKDNQLQVIRYSYPADRLVMYTAGFTE